MPDDFAVATGPPLPTLLSQALVAFTIELDNDFEYLLAAAGARPGFLVSLVMWSNFMRFVDDDGLTVRELSARAGVARGAIHPSLAGMQRWGYVTVRPDTADGRPKPPRPDLIVRATRKGRIAQEVWRPLPDLVEDRWRARFGMHTIDRLRESLLALVAQLDYELPWYLPVLGPGMHPAHFGGPKCPRRDDDVVTALDLSALLSQVLLTFALDFEEVSRLSLPMVANFLRVLDDDGVRMRDVPRRAGVSKEAVSISIGFLERRGQVTVEPDPSGGRSKLVRFTAKGRAARDASRALLATLEDRAPTRFGSENVGNLRAALVTVVGAGDDTSPLFGGLEPRAGGWRASVPRPAVLPHYPMVLHRGGWPDGS
jgi:DNA-binding MarR family transcriptional regulator